MAMHQTSTGTVGGIHEVHLADRDERRITGRHSVELAARRARLEASLIEAERDWAHMVAAIGEDHLDGAAEVMKKYQADIDKASQKLTAIETEIACETAAVPVIS
jgi:hypothetical protein